MLKPQTPKSLGHWEARRRTTQVRSQGSLQPRTQATTTSEKWRWVRETPGIHHPRRSQGTGVFQCKQWLGCNQGNGLREQTEKSKGCVKFKVFFNIFTQLQMNTQQFTEFKRNWEPNRLFPTYIFIVSKFTARRKSSLRCFSTLCATAKRLFGLICKSWWHIPGWCIGDVAERIHILWDHT